MLVAAKDAYGNLTPGYRGPAASAEALDLLFDHLHGALPYLVLADDLVRARLG